MSVLVRDWYALVMFDTVSWDPSLRYGPEVLLYLPCETWSMRITHKQPTTVPHQFLLIDLIKP